MVCQSSKYTIKDLKLALIDTRTHCQKPVSPKFNIKLLLQYGMYAFNPKIYLILRADSISRELTDLHLMPFA